MGRSSTPRAVHKGGHVRPNGIDGSGEYRGQLRVPEGVSIQAMTSNMAVGIQFGEYDEPWLIGYRVVQYD